MDSKNDLKISIITPSFNQAAYIEQTIKSVLAQGYANVEHIVVDGGSSDGTVDILKRYDHLIWISEKDRGQADALNKGLALATGDVIGWINSDDYYEENVFQAVADHFSDPSTQWIVGNVSHVDAEGAQTVYGRSPEVSYERLIRNPDIVRQQPTFFRRAFLERVGGWNAEFFMVMDFDLWTRLAKVSSPKMVDERLAYFRMHPQQKTGLGNVQRQTREICRILKREGASRRIVAGLYLKKQWMAFKACCRIFLVCIGIVKDGQLRECEKHAAG